MENLIKHLHQTMTPLISASHKVVLHSPVPSKPLTAEEAIARETLKVKAFIKFIIYLHHHVDKSWRIHFNP